MRLTFTCLITLFFLLVLNSATTFAQNISQQALSLKDLTLTVATTKQIFLPLEPIPFIMTVKNDLTQPITAYIDLSFCARMVKVFVQGPNGAEAEIEQLSGIIDCGGPFDGTRRMMSSDVVKESETLLYNIERYF